MHRRSASPSVFNSTSSPLLSEFFAIHNFELLYNSLLQIAFLLVSFYDSLNVTFLWPCKFVTTCPTMLFLICCCLLSCFLFHYVLINLFFLLNIFLFYSLQISFFFRCFLKSCNALELYLLDNTNADDIRTTISTLDNLGKNV